VNVRMINLIDNFFDYHKEIDREEIKSQGCQMANFRRCWPEEKVRGQKYIFGQFLANFIQL
jgi:hypothetical protein